MEEGNVRSTRYTIKDRRTPITITTVIVVGSVLLGFILFTLSFPPSKNIEELFRRKRYVELETDDDVCGHQVITLTRMPSFFTSPNFPAAYPKNANCSWLLVAPPDERIRILLSEVDIEPSISGVCQNDYVAIYDGGTRNSKLLGKYCDKPDDMDHLSSGNELLVVFVSDESYDDTGFKLDYSLQIKGNCNTTVVVAENNPKGLLVSPNYPNHYQDDSDCYTHLQTEDDIGQIIFSFAILDLELSDYRCEFDFVEVFDGDEPLDSMLIDRYCHERPPMPVISKGNRLLVHFHSDRILNGKGYVLSYSLSHDFAPKKNSEFGECTWIMDRLNGTITSPNYPRPYGKDQLCEFVLEAPFGQKIKLIFDDVDLGFDNDCESDHVEVYDGDSIDSPEKGVYCSSDDIGHAVVSTSNHLYVRFMSINRETGLKGFKARYVVVAGSNVFGDEFDSSERADDVCKDVNDPTCKDAVGQVTVITRPENASLAIGERHRLSCSSNNSNDIIIWFKDLILLTGDHALQGITKLVNGTIVIKAMNWKLQGVYICVILSSGQMETASAWVKFKKPPRDKNSCDIKFDLTPTKIVLLEGDFDYLRCAAVNAPVTWLRDGQPLDHIDHPRIKVPFPGLLLINNAKPEDSGNFTCIATHNTQNCSASREYNLFVSTKPSKSCGYIVSTSIKRMGKIIGGSDAKRGAIPWQAMLWETEADSFCGGILVDSGWVVTAAHCQELFFKNYGRSLLYDNFYVKLGKTDRTRPQKDDFTSGVDQVIIHPEYNQKTFDNDIALIQLKQKVPMNEYTQPMCLADSRFLNNYVYERSVMGTVSGWGLLSEKGARPTFLQQVQLPTVDYETCKGVMQHAVTKNMFCAGYSQGISSDACQGDSGGPFAVEIHKRWYLAGIVSWGEGCGQKGKYGVYTRVGNYFNWIKNTIQAYKLKENA